MFTTDAHHAVCNPRPSLGVKVERSLSATTCERVAGARYCAFWKDVHKHTGNVLPARLNTFKLYVYLFGWSGMFLRNRLRSEGRLDSASDSFQARHPKRVWVTYISLTRVATDLTQD